jgi:hypothetical protein
VELQQHVNLARWEGIPIRHIEDLPVNANCAISAALAQRRVLQSQQLAVNVAQDGTQHNRVRVILDNV